MLGLELILRLCVCVLCNFWPLFFLNKRGAFFRKTTEHRNTDAVKKNGKQCRQNGTGGEITDRGQGERCAYHPPYYPNPPPPPLDLCTHKSPKSQKYDDIRAFEIRQF
jgi:hypothetical protein